jgi:hypothetical protein
MQRDNGSAIGFSSLLTGGSYSVYCLLETDVGSFYRVRPNITSQYQSRPKQKFKSLRQFVSCSGTGAAAMDQMKELQQLLWDAVLHNRALDARLDGNVVSSSSYAVVSAPEEEEVLWQCLTRAAPAEIGRAFDGTERVSLCCPRMHQQNISVRKDLARGLIAQTDVTTPTLALLEHIRVLISCDQVTLFVVDPINQEVHITTIRVLG